MIPKVDKVQKITHKSLRKVGRNCGMMAQLEAIANEKAEGAFYSEIVLICWYMMMHGLLTALDCPGQLFWSSAQRWPQCYRGEPGGTVRHWYQLSLRCGPFNWSL
ncbi:hypothetical protein ATANTOWER_005430 [Ataeniobius toweri]|uniref:Uncharacterized protein n=1 Tax=Ataeniobius toweri TaxID=208326 RepID=A0ABU7BEG8_9TELE|nr:hypothetical protein [Ataeniobius toweri]